MIPSDRNIFAMNRNIDLNGLKITIHNAARQLTRVQLTPRLCMQRGQGRGGGSSAFRTILRHFSHSNKEIRVVQVVLKIEFRNHCKRQFHVAGDIVLTTSWLIIKGVLATTI